MRRTTKIYFFIVLTFITVTVHSQIQVNVITKSVTKEFVFSGETVFIQGEKSTINFQTWSEKKIKIEMKLISKNPLESKAKRDLEVMHYTFQNDNKYIKANNYFKSNEITDISSNLSVEYSIYIPAKCTIQVINLYGNVILSNMEVTGTIKNSFGEVRLNNISGTLLFDMHYSDLSADNLSGKFTINTRNSDVQLKKISGDFNLKSTYGNIVITSIGKLNNLTINAQRTKVLVAVREFTDFNYMLTTQNDKIIVPLEYTKLIKEESGLFKFSSSSGKTNNSIQINTTYCPITLKSE